jgi:serpin B
LGRRPDPRAHQGPVAGRFDHGRYQAGADQRVYFNGKWKYKFSEAATRDAPFYLADGTSAAAPTMRQLQTFRYGRFDTFQMLEMPYAGDDLSMVVVLPNDRNGLPALEATFSAERFSASLEGLWPREVMVYLPKFTFEASTRLGDPLMDLGMVRAFGGGDFSGISDEGLQIDEVYHKTFIDVNESGTEAAAATAVVATVTSCIPSPPPVFQADHPFLFALRDMHTGSLLFLGRMGDPGAASASALVPEPSSCVFCVALFAALACRRRRASR